jgi:dolichyl-diphosphooligosaccharide--protein glycosyltransferase
MRWSTTAALLAGVVLLGFGLRGQTYQQIFRGDAIVFPVGDSYYHLRRAEYTLEHAPDVLLFDPLVNHPDGAWIPWPPLHTLLLANVAIAIGGTHHDLELAGAWLPPVIGALTALPVFAAARVLAGPGVALLAALLVMLFPMSISYSDVGNADHHCTVSFFGAIWLWGALLAARDQPARSGLATAQALVTIGRLGVVFTWGGSLLYLFIADGAVLGVLALQGRARALRAHAVGLLATAAAVALLVPRLGPPVGGTYTALSISYLHAPALAALALVALACAAAAQRWPDRSVLVRAAQSAAIAAVAGAALLALPGLLPTLREGVAFVGKDDPWAALNAEQKPLFSIRDLRGRLRPIWYYGGFGYFIPLVPLAALAAARDPRRRDSALVLAVWTAGFGALAVDQLRYGGDFAPAGAVGFAVGIDVLRRALPGRRGQVVAALAALLGVGPIVAQHTGQARAEIAARRNPPLGDPLLATATGSLYRFAEEIRRVTPETGGYLDPSARPEYGILAHANVGHVLHYVAHRATPSDNFGPYSASRHWATAQRFFALRSEQKAIESAEALGARYVLSMEYGAVDYRSLSQRLHREDGLEREDSPRFERFRLIAEGPRGGRPLTEFYRGAAPAGATPYKLFEKVTGAVLEVHAAPGSEVEAKLELHSPFGRRFEYVARASAGDDGVARLRVPYASDGRTPVGARGPWLIRVNGATRRVRVSEDAVVHGETVVVEAAAGAAG